MSFVQGWKPAFKQGGPKGKMPWRFWWHKGLVVGGSYYDKPPTLAGVKMAAEIDLPCDVDVPTKDFSVPDRQVFKAGVLRAAKILQREGKLYVGCMGGIGRTGLFLAGLAKLMGEEDPVTYVRLHYNTHAVETAEQKRYIMGLDLTQERRAFKRYMLGKTFQRVINVIIP